MAKHASLISSYYQDQRYEIPSPPSPEQNELGIRDGDEELQQSIYAALRRAVPKSEFLFYAVFDTTIANTYKSTVGHTVFPFSDRLTSSSRTAAVACAMDATVDSSSAQPVSVSAGVNDTTREHENLSSSLVFKRKTDSSLAPPPKRQDFEPTHAAVIERLEKRHLWKISPALQTKIDAIVLPRLTSAEFSTGAAAYAQHYLWVFENGCLWIGKAERDGAMIDIWFKPVWDPPIEEWKGRIFDSPESRAHPLQALGTETLSCYSDNLEDLLQASRMVDGNLLSNYIMEIWAIVDMFPCLHAGVYPDSSPFTRIIGPVLIRRAGPRKFPIWAITKILQEPLPDYIQERFDAASIELFIEDVNGYKKHLLSLNLKHNTIRYVMKGAPDDPVEQTIGYVTLPAKPYWDTAEFTRKLDKFLFVHDLPSSAQRDLIKEFERMDSILERPHRHKVFLEALIDLSVKDLNVVMNKLGEHQETEHLAIM